MASRGGLVSRLDQKLAVADDLIVSQGYALDLALHEKADQVALRMAPSLLDHLVEVLVHVDLRPPLRLAGGLSGPSKLGVLLPDDGVGGLEQALPVFGGNPEDPGDHFERNPACEARHEVALRHLPGRGRLIDNLGGDMPDVIETCPDGAAEELPIGYLAHGTVPGGIQEDDHFQPGHGLRGRFRVAVQGDPFGTGELQRLRGHLDQVGVLGNGPEGGNPGGSKYDTGASVRRSVHRSWGAPWRW